MCSQRVDTNTSAVTPARIIDTILLQADFLTLRLQLAGMSLGLRVGLTANTLRLRRSKTLSLCILLPCRLGETRHDYPEQSAGVAVR
ncbi:hypothetical protein CR157_19885 [Halomonas sp. LBP4]|nr:hypothetical protein CR157_19885 [Halomonas sp. LBP4]